MSRVKRSRKKSVSSPSKPRTSKKVSKVALSKMTRKKKEPIVREVKLTAKPAKSEPLMRGMKASKRVGKKAVRKEQVIPLTKRGKKESPPSSRKKVAGKKTTQTAGIPLTSTRKKAPKKTAIITKTGTRKPEKAPIKLVTTPEGKKLKLSEIKHHSMKIDTKVYARHGKLRDILDAANKSDGEVVYVSPKTGEILKRTTKGQQVLFGYIRADGALKILGPHPQTKNDTLRRWLEKHISSQGEKSFALYEQRGREIMRDERGKPLKTKGGAHRHVSKLAIPSTSKQQRAVLYKQGARARNIEFAYHYHDRAQLLTKLAVEPIRPDGRIVSLNLTGDTVADSMRGIVLDKSLKRLKKWERVFYEWIVIYRDPETGEKITLPGRGKEIPYGLVVTDVREGDPLHPRHFRARLSRVAGLAVAVGHDVRTALASNGKRFTSLFKMHQLENQYAALVEKAELKEDDNRADALQGTLDRIKRPWRNGPLAHALTALNPEDENGKPIRKYADALTIQIRFVIEEDLGLKRQAFAQEKSRKRKKKGAKVGRTTRR